MQQRHAILIAVLLLAAGTTTYFAYRPDGMAEKPSPTLASTTSSVPKAPPLAAPRTPPLGYKEFRNEFYRFQILYPQDLSVTLTKEKGSAATITFDGPGDQNDFEMFVVPYGRPQITEERFKLDQPSGVMNEPRDIEIGGVAARFFYGQNAAMGDTAEIWFINKGFLYEVVTYKNNGHWLLREMQGWMPL